MKTALKNNPEIVNTNGNTAALHKAVMYEQWETVKELLDHTPNLANEVNNDDKGNTVLHKAVRYQKWETVKELLDHTPNLANKVNNDGETALSIMFHSDCLPSLDIIDLLIGNMSSDAIITPNIRNITALNKAVMIQEPEIVKLVLKHAPESINTLDPVGNYSNLRRALNRSDEAKFKILVDVAKSQLSVDQILFDIVNRKEPLEIFKQIIKLHASDLIIHMPNSLATIVGQYIVGASFDINSKCIIQLIEEDIATAPVVIHVQEIENPVTILAGNVSFPEYNDGDWS